MKREFSLYKTWLREILHCHNIEQNKKTLCYPFVNKPNMKSKFGKRIYLFIHDMLYLGWTPFNDSRTGSESLGSGEIIMYILFIGKHSTHINII